MLDINMSVKKGTDLFRGIKINTKGYIRVYVTPGTHVNTRTGEVIDIELMAQALYYGTETIPPRPFLEDAIYWEKPAILEVIKGSLVWRFQGLTADVQYQFASNEILKIVRDFIYEGDYYREVAPNADSTIRQKEGDIPLLDSGQLISHIEAEYVHIG